MAAPSQMAVAGLILGAAFLVGGVAGCLAAGWMDGEGAQALSGYLTSYFRYAAEETPAPGFWNAVWEQFRFLLAAFVLGFTAIGVVGLPVLFGVRGFLSGRPARGVPRAGTVRPGGAGTAGGLWDAPPGAGRGELAPSLRPGLSVPVRAVRRGGGLVCGPGAVRTAGPAVGSGPVGAGCILKI